MMACKVLVLAFLSLAAAADGFNDGGCPVGCSCKDSQTILICEQGRLVDVPTEIPPRSVILDLDYNVITTLHNNSLQTLDRLEILTVRYNRIYKVDVLAFDSLSNLRIVSLQGNHISMLPKYLFRNNNMLEQVDLSYNELWVIPDGTLMHVFDLQVLNVSHNQIISAMLGEGFQYTSKLRLLDLTGNKITALSSDDFKAAQWWGKGLEHVINMSSCDLQSIEQGALANTDIFTGLIFSDNLKIPHLFLQNIQATELKQLDLSNTRLSSLSGYFDNAHLQKLAEMSLSRNLLTEIGRVDFTYMENLQILDLSQNQISLIRGFEGLSKLQQLDLSSNRITKLNSSTFGGIMQVRSLYLQYNNISSISDEIFSDLFYMDVLDMSYNRLRTFDLRDSLETVKVLKLAGNQLDSVSFISRLRYLEELDLSYNAIRGIFASTFQDGQLISKANFSHNRITAIEPLSFHLSALEVLDLSHNLISNLAHFGWKSPVREIYLAYNEIAIIANDAFHSLPSLELLDLSYCRLKELPAGFFDSLFHLKTLLLTGNPLGYFPTSQQALAAFMGLPSLQHLALNKAGLTALPISVCANKTSLRYLDVSDNEITLLHSDMCSSAVNLRVLHISNNHLQKIDSSALECLHSLEVIDLAHNPFSCSCDFLPSCKWLQRTHVNVLQKSQPEGLVCSLNGGQSVAEFCEEGHMTCDMQTHPMLWALITGSAVFLVVMILFCVWRLYMRYRKKRKLSRMMDREMEIQREKMLMQTQLNQFYFKEESL